MNTHIPTNVWSMIEFLNLFNKKDASDQKQRWPYIVFTAFISVDSVSKINKRAETNIKPREHRDIKKLGEIFHYSCALVKTTLL